MIISKLDRWGGLDLVRVVRFFLAFRVVRV